MGADKCSKLSIGVEILKAFLETVLDVIPMNNI